MRRHFTLIIFIGLALPVLPLFAAGVTINEVLFDPSDSDTGAEWIEVYNGGQTQENLSGWQLYPDGVGYFSFPAGFTVGPKKFVVVHLRASGASSIGELYHPAATANMGNTAGSAALFSGEPGKDTIKSFVEWGRGGETWESAAAYAGLWTKGMFVSTSSVAEGSSIGLVVDGEAALAKDAWIVLSSPTPGSANSHVVQGGSSAPSPASPTSSSPSVSSGSSGVSSSAPASAPSLWAYAGEDIAVVAGSQVQFVGTALGIKKEPLEGARLWWNFGDGATGEGRAVSHIFQVPGTYLAGLHVSLGSDGVSDYRFVTVLPNKIAISGVVSGGSGFVRLSNPGQITADIGEWTLKDAAGKNFLIPQDTKIGAGAEIALANVLTGLLAGSQSLPITLYYPNLAVASVWEREGNAVPPSATPVGAEVSATHTLRWQGEASKKDVRFTISSSSAAGLASTVPMGESAPPLMLAQVGVAPQPLHPNIFLWLASALSVCAAAGFIVIKKRYL